MWPTGDVNIEKEVGLELNPEELRWIEKCLRTVRVPQQHVAPDLSNMS